MNVERLAIPDIILLVPPRFGDSRGTFSETYSAKRLKEIGIDYSFVQDNQSWSRAKGTLRGLHCQVGAHAQGKLVRVIRGAIWDVGVDVRRGSAHFGAWAAATLTAEAGEQLWIPPGFLHGFVTLEPDTEVLYKVTAAYDQAAERGVIWNDPTLAISWPLTGVPTLSDKDQALPNFSAADRWGTDGR